MLIKDIKMPKISIIYNNQIKNIDFNIIDNIKEDSH